MKRDVAKACKPILCACASFGSFALGKNRYQCHDGHSGYCAWNQYCVSSEFVKGNFTSACKDYQESEGQVECGCDSPGSQTPGENGYKCKDGTDEYCASNQFCTKLHFMKHHLASACEDFGEGRGVGEYCNAFNKCRDGLSCSRSPPYHCHHNPRRYYEPCGSTFNCDGSLGLVCQHNYKGLIRCICKNYHWWTGTECVS